MRTILLVSFLIWTTSSLGQNLTPSWVHSYAYYQSPNRAHLSPAKNPRNLQYVENATSKEIKDRADSVATQNNRVALMLIDQGQVVYKRFNGGAGDDSMLISYSRAKSLTALAVGTALCASYIKSLDDKAEKYAPLLEGTAYGKSTIRDLLRMSSGADASGKHGEPFPTMSTDLRLQKIVYEEQFKRFGQSRRGLFKNVAPGDEFDYKNLDTAALGLVVMGATNQSFQNWFQSTVVEEAGLSRSSAWALDRNNVALTHVYYYATLEDWGRLGLYALDSLLGLKGPCMQDFLRKSVNDRIRIFNNGDFASYGYQFWTPLSGASNQSFWMIGYGGQFVGIDPEQKKIIVTSSTDYDSEPFKLFRSWTRAGR